MLSWCLNSKKNTQNKNGVFVFTMNRLRILFEVHKNILHKQTALQRSKVRTTFEDVTYVLMQSVAMLHEDSHHLEYSYVYLDIPHTFLKC